jgi:hypothetical protein
MLEEDSTMGMRRRFWRTAVWMAVVTGGALIEAAPRQAGQTATDFYMAYRAAFDKATRLDEILPYMSATNRKQAESTPKEERDKIFEMIKMLDSHSKVTVTREDRQGDGSVVLSVSAYDTERKQDISARVTIVKEDGAWKLGKEDWTARP